MDTLSIRQLEDALHEQLRNLLSQNETDNYVWDGFCYGELDSTPGISADEKWRNSKRRILFLAKEPNGNEGEDYREWDHARGKGKDSFCRTVAKLMHYLTNITTDTNITECIPPSREEIFANIPYAQVNIKKTAGKQRVDWGTVWSAAEQNGKLIKKHIREILQPNIVVCCGSNDSETYATKMISIAREFIYPDIGFTQINARCYFNEEEHILLIDSYHPTAIKSDDEIMAMAEAFKDALEKGIKLS